MNKTEKSENIDKKHSQSSQKPIRRVRNGPADSNTWNHWNQWRHHLIRAWSASQVQGICCIAAVSSRNSYNRLKWSATEVLRAVCNHKSRGITWKIRERTKVRNQWQRGNGRMWLHRCGCAAYSGGGCPQGTISAIGPRENLSEIASSVNYDSKRDIFKNVFFTL